MCSRYRQLFRVNDTESAPTAGAVASAAMSLMFFKLSDGLSTEIQSLNDTMNRIFDDDNWDGIINYDKNESELHKLRRNRTISTIAATFTACYAGTEGSIIIYNKVQ